MAEELTIGLLAVAADVNVETTPAAPPKAHQT